MNICETKDIFQRLCPVGLYKNGRGFPSMLVGGQFSPVKTFYFFLKKLKADVEETGWILNGQYSQVDVEKVDMYKFPKFRNLPWYEVKMQKGDCIFIPFK